MEACSHNAWIGDRCRTARVQFAAGSGRNILTGCRYEDRIAVRRIASVHYEIEWRNLDLVRIRLHQRNFGWETHRHRPCQRDWRLHEIDYAEQ
ncbi:hypothetical protein DMC47_36410 [Nostoc sp. 3335mG]|nr:hypothetical protein DMC47_36410 [Nostoc sp. 3335mG]